MHTGVSCDIDFGREGKQFGTVALPYSIDRSPYFRVSLPICQVRNGEGPAVLLMAGVHGDEYEGKIALSKLMRRVEPGSVRGRLTILPAANGPAVYAGRRCSPFDRGNLNRAFPGDRSGGPTWRIAHFIESGLMPGHDVVFDLHSGGTSMDHLACGLAEVGRDAARDATARALLEAMGMPYALLADNGPDSPTTMAAALRAGAVGISGEFGGGATVTPARMEATERAIDNVLQACGLTQAPLLRPGAAAPEGPTVFLRQGGEDHFVYGRRDGWFEPAVEVGDRVEAGEVVGFSHALDIPGVEPETYHARTEGVVMSRRLHSHFLRGDCLFTIGGLA